MGAPKDEYLALSSEIGLAGLAINYFHESRLGTLGIYSDKIIELLVKPNKTTAVHWYFATHQNICEEIINIKVNVDELDYLFDFIYRILDEVELYPDLPVPDFDNCTNQWHEDCSCNDIVEQ